MYNTLYPSTNDEGLAITIQRASTKIRPSDHQTVNAAVLYLGEDKRKAEQKRCRTLTLQLPRTMATRATTLMPPERRPPTKGTVVFSYTFVGLSCTAIIVVLIIFCKYRVHGRSPVVVTTGAGRVAESNPEERRHVGVEFSYNESSSRRGGGSDGAHCSVCLGRVQPGEKVRRLPLCKHLYHVECIDMWLASHTTCRC